MVGAIQRLVLWHMQLKTSIDVAWVASLNDHVTTYIHLCFSRALLAPFVLIVNQKIG